MSSETQNNGLDGVDVKQANALSGFFPLIVILVALAISYTVFYTLFAAPENFQNGPTLKEELDAWNKSSSEWKSGNKDIITAYEKEYKSWEDKYQAWEKDKRKWQRENPTWEEDKKAWEKKKKDQKMKLSKWEQDSTAFAEQNKDAIAKWEAETKKLAPKPNPNPNPIQDWISKNAKPAEYTAPEPGFPTPEPTISMEEPICPCGEEPKHWTKNDPMPGNYFGIIYKGGPVIPLGFTLMLCVIAFSIERAITLSRAKGKGSVDVFVKKVRMQLADGNIEGAISECDRQQGSVASVVKAGLKKYREVEGEDKMDKDQKKLAIQTELEEATTLELPMLEKNLPIIATIVAIGVLVGLFGTVLGMIKAFSALATAGAPDASELATGISEALVNTAVGIFNSAIAIVVYNYFTSYIDGLTYNIDEAGYSIIQTFDMKH